MLGLTTRPCLTKRKFVYLQDSGLETYADQGVVWELRGWPDLHGPVAWGPRQDGSTQLRAVWGGTPCGATQGPCSTGRSRLSLNIIQSGLTFFFILLTSKVACKWTDGSDDSSNSTLFPHPFSILCQGKSKISAKKDMFRF